MTIDGLTRKQADALTALLHSFRPDWDKPGIWSAVAAAKDVAPGRDVAVAAIRASGLGSNRTPAIIPLEGPHWRGSDHAPRHPNPAPDERCSVCSKRKGMCVGHEFVSVVAAVRAAETVDRAELLAGLRAVVRATKTKEEAK